MKQFILLIAIFFYCPVSHAQHAGDLDSSFGNHGLLNVPFYAYAIAGQSDGKIIAGGENLGRYNPDGTVDNSFGQDGIVYLDFNYNQLRLQNDGKIILTKGFSLVRYNADGSADDIFNNNVVSVPFNIHSAAIQNNNKIIVIGSMGTEDPYDISDFAIARYNSDGSLDKSFGDNGIQTTDFGKQNNEYGSDAATAVVIQKDGKIIVAGNTEYSQSGDHYSQIAIARYTPAGNLDDSFSGAGKLAYGSFYGSATTSAALLSDGKIVVIGDILFDFYSSALFIGLFTPQGSVLAFPIFSNNTDQIRDKGGSVAIQNDDKIIVSGSAIDGSILIRFNADGSIDHSFSADAGNPNRMYMSISDILLSNDSKLYAVGGLVARYLLEDVNKNLVTIFTLVNADTDDDIQSIPDGSILDINTLPQHVNIRANTNPNKVGSVVFILDGKKIRTENGVPYALAGDSPTGDYHNWTLPLGDHTLAAIPYSNYNGKGTVGTSLTIHFTVVGQRVESFTLINAETDKSIQLIADGAIIDLNKLPAHQLNIRANTNPGKVGSVVFILDGKKVRTENGAPYALAGDSPSGDYHAWALPLGDHTLTAIPYSNYNGKGTEGISLTIHFTVVGDQTNLFTSAGNLIISTEVMNFSLYPNPANKILNITIGDNQPNGKSTVSIINSSGAMVRAIKVNSRNKIVQLNVSSLTPGTYFIKIISGDKVRNKRFVKL